MKNLLPIITLTILIHTSCERISTNPDQFLFKTDCGIEYNASDIELYDSSTHIFYLKTNHPEFDNESGSNFSVWAYGEEVYSGVFWPMFSSSLPEGPYISSMSFCPDFTIRIEHISIDNEPSDPRNDPKLISALEELNLLHSGLSIDINNIDINENQLNFEFTVTNNDESDLLILDLNKTGHDLFHYFTNGLYIRTMSHEEVFSCQIEPQIPSPWDSWSPEWLSEIKSGKSKQFTINYSINSSVPPGEYYALFEFPGLTHGLTKEQLYLNDSRIWVGDISISKEITIQ